MFEDTMPVGATATRKGTGDAKPGDGPAANPATAIPTIDTPRLRLRPHRLDDFDAYARMWTEPEVVRFIGGVPLSREAAWIRFLRQIGLWYHFGFGFLAIEDRNDARFLGECGLHEMRRAVVPSIEGTIECGWALTAAGQGRGLAVEAMRAVLAWADVHHPGRRRTCLISTGNAASIAVATRLGFAEFARTVYHDDPVVLMEQAAGAVTG